MDQQRARRMVAEVIAPYFAGTERHVNSQLLVCPEQIADLLRARLANGPPDKGPIAQSACPPRRPRAACLLQALFSFRHSHGKRVAACVPPNRLICRFSSDYRHLPSTKLFVGGKWKKLWVTPLEVELCDNGASPGDWRELGWRFRLSYDDGTTGEAAFIDRKRPDGGYRRIHRFADGALASSDHYPHSRLNHDVFRTLLALVIYLESDPAAADFVQELLPAEVPTMATPPALAAAVSTPQPLRLMPKPVGPAWAAVHRLPAAMTTADETPRARHRS